MQLFKDLLRINLTAGRREPKSKSIENVSHQFALDKSKLRKLMDRLSDLSGFSRRIEEVFLQAAKKTKDMGSALDEKFKMKRDAQRLKDDIQAFLADVESKYQGVKSAKWLVDAAKTLASKAEKQHAHWVETVQKMASKVKTKDLEGKGSVGDLVLKIVKQAVKDYPTTGIKVFKSSFDLDEIKDGFKVGRYIPLGNVPQKTASKTKKVIKRLYVVVVQDVKLVKGKKGKDFKASAVRLTISPQKLSPRQLPESFVIGKVDQKPNEKAIKTALAYLGHQMSINLWKPEVEIKKTSLKKRLEILKNPPKGKADRIPLLNDKNIKVKGNQVIVTLDKSLVLDKEGNVDDKKLFDLHEKDLRLQVGDLIGEGRESKTGTSTRLGGRVKPLKREVKGDKIVLSYRIFPKKPETTVETKFDPTAPITPADMIEKWPDQEFINKIIRQTKK